MNQELLCGFCIKPLQGKTQRKYCSHSCAFRDMIKKRPEFQKQAALASKLEKERNSEIAKERTLRAVNGAVRWRKENPEMSAAISSFAGLRNSEKQTHEFFSNMGKKGGKKGGKRTHELHPDLASSIGKVTIWKAQRGKFVYHDDHFHRSRGERDHCVLIQPNYSRESFHPNFRYKSTELDWLISSDIVDITVWEKIIEYHQVQYWRDETKESYIQKRTEKIRSLGITCPVEFVFP